MRERDATPMGAFEVPTRREARRREQNLQPRGRRCVRCGAILARDNPLTECSNHTHGDTLLARDDHPDPVLNEVIATVGNWPERSNADRAQLIGFALKHGIQLSDTQAGEWLDRYAEPYIEIQRLAELARRLDVPLAHPPACHRFQNACGCPRCTDRVERADRLKQADVVPLGKIADQAKRDSDEHFGMAA